SPPASPRNRAVPTAHPLRESPDHRATVLRRGAGGQSMRNWTHAGIAARADRAPPRDARAGGAVGAADVGRRVVGAVGQRQRGARAARVAGRGGGARLAAARAARRAGAGGAGAGGAGAAARRRAGVALPLLDGGRVGVAGGGAADRPDDGGGAAAVAGDRAAGGRGGR